MENRSGVVAVKSEFLVKTERKQQAVIEIPLTNSETGSEGKQQAVIEAPLINCETGSEENALPPSVEDSGIDMAEGESKKRKNDTSGRNQVSTKKRHQECHPEKNDRLCSFVTKGEECPFKGECKYNHDIADYLSTKAVDLGTVCYQYSTFGYCSNGVMCRFGDSHIDKLAGKSFTRPDAEGGIVPRVHMNVLRKEVQVALRKKKYDDYLRVTKAAATSTATATTEVADSSPSPSVEPQPGSTETGSGDGGGPSAVDSPVVSSAALTDRLPTASASAGGVVGSAARSAISHYNLSAFPDKCVKLVDFSNKVYVAPLTTVGNLPFRRIMKDFGADITCGEMAMASNLEAGQASEWALLRRHPGEDVYGVQIAGNHTDMMSRVGRILEHETTTDFVDLNCGCPIDVVCNRGCGSSLMNKHNKLCDIAAALAKSVPSRSITVKVRTGWDEKNPTTHKLLPLLQKCTKDRIAAVFIHGRSRLQRYSKLANWEYVLQAAQAQDPALRRIPVVGNGDIFSWEDWRDRQQFMQGSALNDTDPEAVGLCSCAMIGRGALIKPWLPTEIKEQRLMDISASDRLDMLKNFCNYGLEHWGSDQQGVNTTRRFLLEWLSFLHRYVPMGLVESAQKMNQRPPHYFGRCDVETLFASQNSADWVRISELLLGPVPDGFGFIPKHKSNAYSAEAETVSNG